NSCNASTAPRLDTWADPCVKLVLDTPRSTSNSRERPLGWSSTRSTAKLPDTPASSWCLTLPGALRMPRAPAGMVERDPVEHQLDRGVAGYTCVRPLPPGGLDWSFPLLSGIVRAVVIPAAWVP